MTVTAPTDVSSWIPSLISTAVHDKGEANDHPLSAFATFFPDLEGKPGETFTVPNLDAVDPATNLAVTVAATDDNLSGAGVTMTIKEAVKSIAFYDRTKYATGTDFNSLAGTKVGAAVNDRIELDLAAAAFAGRNVSKDTISATLTLASLRALKLAIPARLRKRGLVLFGEADILEQLLSDTAVSNAANFGSDEAIREGQFSRPLSGVKIVALDEGTMPVGATNGLPQVALMSEGMLIRAMQKQPSIEVERSALARLTRVVGTALHGEGVQEAAGVVFSEIGTP